MHLLTHMCPSPGPLGYQGFYMQMMSHRALFLAAACGGFRTWLSDSATHHSISLRLPPPEKSPQEATATWPPNTDHRPRVTLGITTAYLWHSGEGPGGMGCSSQDDGCTCMMLILTQPRPSRTRWIKETQTQAQKDIKPNIYTKYYSF